jgi:hypothetical protein
MRDITVYDLIKWKHAIKLEQKGLRHSSGRSVTAHAKRHLGIRSKSVPLLLAEIEKILEAVREIEKRKSNA